MSRRYTQLDHAIRVLDEALRLSTGLAPEPERPNPAAATPSAELDENARLHAAGLMRVNHTGEICAQALYAGQAATARNPRVRESMEQAAREEIDHLAWCESRLTELDSHTSYLNPLWYAGAFAIGALAGLAGDRWSLGFLKETENQVEAHLEDHLGRLPTEDQRSQAILEQMKTDEAKHADMAATAGAADLPEPIRQLMRFSAGVMKAVAYRI